MLNNVAKVKIFTDLSEKVRIYSMRVLMPNGILVTVEKEIPAAETRISFNGREMRFCERATELGYANGIGFFARVPDYCGVATGESFFIGNLSNEFVREVLATLVRQEYLDLSDLRLQKTQPMVSNYKFDNGVSGAYMLHGFEAGMCCAEAVPFMGMATPSVGEAEDAEDAEDTGEEDEQ